MRWLGLGLVALAVGCGGNDEQPPVDGALVVDAPRVDAPVGTPDAAPGTPDATPATPDGAPGAACGGFVGATCPPDQWCDYDANSCGSADEPGTCRPRPMGCPQIYDPVCGCDGLAHGNECEANAAGFDVSGFGGCEPPAGMFGCGYRFCAEDAEYCRHAVSDVVGIPDDFACLSLPGSCPTPATCACLAGESCGMWCTASPDGDLTVTCPGG